MDEKKVLLITTINQRESTRETYLRETEARSLIHTLGLEVGHHQQFTIKEENPNTFIGMGQAAEAAMVAEELQLDEVIINVFLTPRQEKNLEKIFGLPVSDRENLILSIFFQNAHSKEARLQIMKAEAEYLKPRLQNREDNLSQQRGGVRGAKGEGERKIELQRRFLSERIAQLEREIEEVRRVREVQRKGRKDGSIFSFALVGYTNAGKSSIMKALTGSDVLVEDKLFATLDTTTRALTLPNTQKVLLSDTVGFIQDLPHRLISAFSSTLDEALDASAVIIVLDLSHPAVYTTFETTRDTLEELGALDKIRLLVLNKVDQQYDDISLARLQNLGIPYVVTSVKENIGLDSLLEKMADITEEEYITLTLHCDVSGKIYGRLPKDTLILSADYKDDALLLKVRIRREMESYCRSLV